MHTSLNGIQLIRLALTCALLALGTVLAGCSSTQEGGANSSGTTGDGVYVHMYVTDADNASILLVAEPDGTLKFGGGFDASMGKTNWSGSLTPEEQSTLAALIAQHKWFDQDPASTHEPKDRIYRIRVRSGRQSNAFTVKGESPDVRPVFDMLEQAARRRNQTVIDALPQAGPQK